MKKDDLKKVIHIADVASIIVVSVAVLAIIIGSVMLFFPQIERINKVELDYAIKYDSIKVDVNDSTSVYAKIDPVQINRINKNNKELFNSIDDLIKNYEERHNEVISSNKKQVDFISYAAAIFAFIISIASFFGFKSINEMKKAAIETAEFEARIVSQEQSKSTAETVAKKIASDVSNNYLEKSLTRDVKEISKATTLELLSGFDERIVNIENSFEGDVNGNNSNQQSNKDDGKSAEIEPFNEDQL